MSPIPPTSSSEPTDLTLPTDPSSATKSNPTPATAPPSSNANTTAPAPTPEDPRPKKRKRDKDKGKEKEAHILHTSTLRNPRWTYLHLTLLTSSSLITTRSHTSNHRIKEMDLDPISITSLLTQPLTSFLGHMGASVPIDILKIKGREVWVRVPREDGRGVVAALGGWVGWVSGESLGVSGEAEGENGSVQVGWGVRGRGEWLGALGGGEGGGELFGG